MPEHDGHATIDELKAAAGAMRRTGIRDDELHALVRALVAGKKWDEAVALCPDVEASVLAGWQTEAERLAALDPPFWPDLGRRATAERT